MNQSLISNYVEYLRKMGYSAQTIHTYSKALEQAPDTWDTNAPGKLYERINNTLHQKQDYFFLPSDTILSRHPVYYLCLSQGFPLRINLTFGANR